MKYVLFQKKCWLLNLLEIIWLSCGFFCIFQLTGQVTLQIASEPVLPFNALDIALEVQNSLKGNFVTGILFSINTVGKKKDHLFPGTDFQFPLKW